MCAINKCRIAAVYVAAVIVHMALWNVIDDYARWRNTHQTEPDSDEEVHNSSDSDASSDHEADSSNNTSAMQAANEEKLTTASGTGTGVGSLSGGNYVTV